MSNQLMDKSNGAYIDLTNFELFFGFSLEVVDSTVLITSNDQTQWFELIQDLGHVKQQQNTLFYTHIQTHSIQDKRFRIGCIPSRAGTFSGEIYFPNFYVNKDHDLDDELQIVDSTCEETLTFNSKIIVNNKENNHHMIDGICKYTVDGIRSCFPAVDEIPSYGYYAFHVKNP